MHELTFYEGKRKKICKNIVVLFDTWLFKYLLKPILFILPPTLITMVAAKKGLQDELALIFGSSVGKYFNESAFLIIVSMFLYIVLMKAIYAAINNYSKPEGEIKFEDLMALLRAIDIVVADKTKRMAKQAKDENHSGGKKIFLQITRPDQQIPLLIRGVRNVFEFICKVKADFRVGLLRIEDKKPVEWYSFDPESSPPRTSLKTLSAPASTVSRCVKSKSIIVVNDIQKELSKKSKKDRRFIKGSTQDSENGSQLCYPIIHPATSEVEYVITIAGNRSCCLKEINSELYTWIIKHFALRISLEHSLLVMKEKVENE